MKEKLLCILEKHANELKQEFGIYCSTYKLEIDSLIIYILQNYTSEIKQEKVKLKFLPFLTVTKTQKLPKLELYIRFQNENYPLTLEEANKIFAKKVEKQRLEKESKLKLEIEQLNRLC